ncbi:uncharacterized protein LOC123869516 [Maniola jurtina]|uniref:uncharacterized protein LOC123869516 n=1 Tax=Maniola jurtina TaxID=191418 RepID=UPI001E68D6AA|nr:uncharacterized protein LOC123869516 [Maniola jurtina]
MFKKTVICILFIILHVIYLGYSSSHKNFGSFNYNVSNIVMCKGPKRYDCCNTAVKIENGKRMLLSVDVKSNVIPNRGKISITVNGQLLVRMQLKKPCNNIFLKPLIQKLLNVTQECEIQQGLYNMSFDIERLAQEYYGGMFFYGNLTFKSLIYNDNCNFFCMLIEAILSPKNSP